MPDPITIIVSAISTALGAGLAFVALKNRSEQKLHSKETEIAALKAKGNIVYISKILDKDMFFSSKLCIVDARAYPKGTAIIKVPQE